MEKFPVNESALKLSDSVKNDWKVSASGWLVQALATPLFLKDVKLPPQTAFQWVSLVVPIGLAGMVLGKLWVGLSVLKYRFRCISDPSKQFCEVAYGVPAFIGTSVRAPWNKGEVSFSGGVYFRGYKRWFAIPATEIIALTPGSARQWIWQRPALRIDFQSPQGYLSSVYLMGVKHLDDPATLTEIRAQMAEGELAEDCNYPPTFVLGPRGKGSLAKFLSTS